MAEDHPLYRDALTTLLGAPVGWEVVDGADDGIGAVTAAHTTQSDVVLMDLNLHGLDGIEATRRIVTASPNIGVLVLTMYDDAWGQPFRTGLWGVCRGMGEAEAPPRDDGHDHPGKDRDQHQDDVRLVWREVQHRDREPGRVDRGI